MTSAPADAGTLDVQRVVAGDGAVAAEPVILTIPATTATYSMLTLDPYGDIFDTGIPAATPGVYALTGPGYSGGLPAGVTAVALPLNDAVLIFRADKYSSSGEDQQVEAERFRASLQLQPLSGYLSDPAGGSAMILPEVAFAIPYKTIADLKRKKIGAVTGSGSYGTFLLYLDKQGLSEKDFAIVNMKVEDLRASVEHGIIDAGIAWEPHVAIAETLGGVRRIASMDGVNESPNFVLARRTFLESQPDLVVRYIATLIELEKFIQADPGEAGRLAAAEIGKGGVAVKPEAMALALRRIKLSPRLTPALLGELEEIAKSMLSTGKIKQMPDFAALARYDLYDRAASIAVK